MDNVLIEKQNIIKKEEKTERILKWDNLKFLLIFLVVLGHILELYLSNGTKSWGIKRLRFFIYTFHMPLFLFISGMFSKKNIDNKRYTNIFYYLVMYFVLKFISFISNSIIFKSYSFSLLETGGVPWYFFVLFAFSLITILVRKTNKIFVFMFSIILGCIIGYDGEIGDFLCLSRIIVFYPFFYLGYCLKSEKVIEFTSKKLVKIVSLLIIIAFAYIIYTKIKFLYEFSPLLSGRNPYDSLKDFANYGGIARLIQYIAVFILGFSIISVIPSGNKITCFATLGKRSIQTYVLHYPILNVLFFGVFNPNVYLRQILPMHPKLLIIPIAFLITVICSLKIFEKPFKIIKDCVTIEHDKIKQIES